MSTAIRSSLTDHSTLDGTGDEINGSEVDENGFTVADILDGTTSTDLAGAGVVDFVFTTSRSGLRLIDLDNAASAIHTALTVEWDPGDGGNLTDNGSGIGIDFIMPDDADNQDTYASINTMVVSDATTAEEGELSFKVVKAGTNTEVLTIGSGVSTFSQKITVGVNDTGHDVKFFGASAGAYMEWDESADQLRIMGASADATTSTGKLLLATSLDDINANDVLGKIDFQAPHETGTDAITVAASIEAIAQATFSSSVNATDLIFSTGSSGAASEKFRFTSDGELGVGGANYGTDGQVLTSTGAGTAPAWEDATAGDITGVTAGVGLSGGGSSGAVTLTLDLSELSTVTPANGDFFSTLDSDGAQEQKTSTTALATLFAGAGMTATSAVLNVIGGDGITANSNDVAITPAQTTITSIYATDLIIGEDSETAIDFGTADEIDFKINNTAELTLSATALYPIADAGLDLGTSALGYNDLHLGASGIINFDNANMKITHSTGALTVAGGTFAAAAITGTTIDATTDFTIGGTVITDNTITDDGTLAIVTTNESVRFHGAQSGSDGAFASLDGYSTTDSSVLSRISFLRNGADNAGGISFHVDDSATLNQAAIITNDGKVGIGMTAPGYPLDVQGTVASMFHTKAVHGGITGLNEVKTFASSSAADGDVPWQLDIQSKNDAASLVNFAQIAVFSSSLAASSRSSSMRFIMYNSGSQTAATLNSSGSWVDASGEAGKEYEGTRQEVWPEGILSKIKNLRVSKYHAANHPKDKPITQTHVSPTAEDFWDALEIGEDPRAEVLNKEGENINTPGIAPKNLAGVALVAIQELLERVEVLESA